MINENEFVDVIVARNAAGEATRTTLANMPWCVGDKPKFTDLEKRTIGANGNEFVAAVTADGGFVSANALLRRGNGINYGTADLSEAAKKLYAAINSAEGLTLEIAKTFKADNNQGSKTTYYRFGAIDL